MWARREEAAVLAGAKSFTAIGQWARTLAPTTATRLGVYTRPETSTNRRVLSALDPVMLDALSGAWMWLRCGTIAGRVVVSFDGKTVRGAKNSGNRAPHLVAGLLHGPDVVITQTAVDAKTNEIPTLRGLLTQMTLTRVLVIADALHTQVETARQILTQHGAYSQSFDAGAFLVYNPST